MGDGESECAVCVWGARALRGWGESAGVVWVRGRGGGAGVESMSIYGSREEEEIRQSCRDVR